MFEPSEMFNGVVTEPAARRPAAAVAVVAVVAVGAASAVRAPKDGTRDGMTNATIVMTIATTAALRRDVREDAAAVVVATRGMAAPGVSAHAPAARVAVPAATTSVVAAVPAAAWPRMASEASRSWMDERAPFIVCLPSCCAPHRRPRASMQRSFRVLVLDWSYCRRAIVQVLRLHAPTISVCAISVVAFFVSHDIAGRGIARQ